MFQIYGKAKSLSSTEPQIFYLSAGKVSAGLARDRLWQVKEGSAYLRLLIDDQEVGSMPVPESGWFLVPGKPIFANTIGGRNSNFI